MDVGPRVGRGHIGPSSSCYFDGSKCRRRRLSAGRHEKGQWADAPRAATAIRCRRACPSNFDVGVSGELNGLTVAGQTADVRVARPLVMMLLAADDGR